MNQTKTPPGGDTTPKTKSAIAELLADRRSRKGNFGRAVGNRWYRYLCVQRGLDPVATYAELSERYKAPHLRGPFNLAARRAAGFDEAELAALGTMAG